MLDTTPATKPSSQQTVYKKKLIEVALPLQAISKASAREKSIRHGHPSTLHIWWARRPLAACRAVLFASLVDDPSSDPELFPTIEDQARERKRLFDLIEQLVQWESSFDERVLERARDEIRKSFAGDLPTIYDPFCGGGSIPVEAQRLGLPTLASDSNPVAVLITKALTEIPWRVRGHAPVHQSLQGPLHQRSWERATGLAADVEAYGKWVFNEARKRVGWAYPPATLATGASATVIAWLWARTIRCTNPLCGAEIPLVKSLILSKKKGSEWCLDPIIDRKAAYVGFNVRRGLSTMTGTLIKKKESTVGATCLACSEPVDLKYIRAEGIAGRVGSRLLAVVVDGPEGRACLAPTSEDVRIAQSASPTWTPDTDLPERALGFRVQGYGVRKHRDLFTPRQLLTLTTISDLIGECRERVLADAIAAGLKSDGVGLEARGEGAIAYADAVVTYLALALSKLSERSSSFCSWDPGRDHVSHVFGRQTLSMVWDYAEVNPFSNSSGNFGATVSWLAGIIAKLAPMAPAQVDPRDASDSVGFPKAVFCTDPPYYDNVPYADLSDFFYTWLRSALGKVYPTLFATILVPKARELVADVSRFAGDRTTARKFFEDGFLEAFRSMGDSATGGCPITVFYAFKQGEQGAEGPVGTERSRSSIGWEAMLAALVDAQLAITGTWPLSTERAARFRSRESNALASSIVLACQPREKHASRCTRADFVTELRLRLPVALNELREASLAATDIEQAAVGPGMAVFSQYSEVLEPDGTSMSVRSALGAINQELAQILLGEIADVDAETHFALAWFDGHFYDEVKYGEAELLLRAKNATLSPLRESGVVRAERGLVQMLRPSDLKGFGLLSHDDRARTFPAWAQLMYLIGALTSPDGGTALAAQTFRAIGTIGAARLKDMAYHCYLACDRAKRSTEAQDFNALVSAWPDLEKLAGDQAIVSGEQLLL